MADDTLRSLIRLIPAANSLKDQLEKSIHLEIYTGTGDFAVKSVQGLQASVAQITNDPLVANMAVTPAEGATDKEKVSLALLAASQIAAYLEGQTGLAGGGSYGGGGGHSHNIQVQKAPAISLNDVQGIPASALEKIVDIAAQPPQKEEK